MNLKQIQTELKDRGFYTAAVDGISGPATKLAIRRFQASVGLNADGIYGPKTQAALFETEEAEDEPAIETKPTPAPTPKTKTASGVIVPRVVDIYHGDEVHDGFQGAVDAGVWGIIHKASQGCHFVDRDYADRRKLAKKAGLLWGAYHFNSGEDPKAQVDYFLRCAQPDDDTLMVLDFEDNKKSPMSVHQAVDFLHALERKLGRKGAIYSGNMLKETIGKLSADDAAYIRSHRLWLCQYGPKAKLPAGFDDYWLWQYTGDGIGMKPHYVPGITVPGGKGIDLNIYNGTREQLASEWA